MDRLHARGALRCAVGSLALLLLSCTEEGNGRSPASPAGRDAAWEVRAPAPTERSEVATATVGTLVYVSGGFRGDRTTIGTVEVHDTEADAWVSAPDLPVEVNHPMSAAANGRVYVLGGYLASGELSDRAFVLAGGRWQELPPMPEGRAAGGAAAVDEELVVAGGVGPAGLAEVTLIFDTSLGTWASAPGLSIPREHLGVASLADLVYAVGGRAGGLDGNLAAAEAFDPASGVWTTLPEMPTARGGLSAAGTDNLFVIAVGGEGPAGTFEEVEAFDVLAREWVSLPPLPTPRHGLGVAAVGEVLYAIAGGRIPRLSVSDVNEAIDLRSLRT